MGLEVVSPLVLLLMRLKHGHIKVAPATHSITDEIKLLRLTSGSLESHTIHTGDANKVGRLSFTLGSDK